MSNPNPECDERVTLPEWTECQSMFADGTATALSEFIRAYEPIQSTNPDDKAADEWRLALTAILNDAATRMRDRCVGKMKELRDEWESKRNELEPLSKMRNRYDAAFCAANEAIVALQSLTLEHEQEKPDGR